MHPDHRPPYIHLIPLAEIITKAVDQKNPFTQKVTKLWTELIDAFGSEINVLLDVDIKEISKITIPAVTEAIQAFRDKKVIIIPGGGGEYGKIKLPTSEQNISLPITPKDKQTSLFEYKYTEVIFLDYKKAEEQIKKIIERFFKCFTRCCRFSL